MGEVDHHIALRGKGGDIGMNGAIDPVNRAAIARRATGQHGPGRWHFLRQKATDTAIEARNPDPQGLRVHAVFSTSAQICKWRRDRGIAPPELYPWCRLGGIHHE
ncbi:hypothetical protein AA15973_0193 [Komagataeibacter sucrofermentans DSM 15973]|nr:hypothetical protein AA15973_0193 [Komagataeibacter sucrofermentans DSM 15973]